MNAIYIFLNLWVQRYLHKATLCLSGPVLLFYNLFKGELHWFYTSTFVFRPHASHEEVVIVGSWRKLHENMKNASNRLVCSEDQELNWHFTAWKNWLVSLNVDCQSLPEPPTLVAAILTWSEALVSLKSEQSKLSLLNFLISVLKRLAGFSQHKKK